jgi:hypothetical protein
MNRIKAFLRTIAVVACICSAASAASLPASSSILSTGAGVPIGGLTIAGGVPIPFVAGTFSGTLTTTVISGDTSNPHGGLTFTYLLTNDVSSSHAIGRFTVNDYAGFLVDANYQTPTVNQIPTLFDRSSGSGDTVGQSFIAPIAALPGFGQGVLAPGSTSALFVLQTNAPFFQPTLANVIDGSIASVVSYAPSLFIPEPSTLALTVIGAAAAGVGLARRRRSPWRSLHRNA